MDQTYLTRHLDFLTSSLAAGRLSGTEGALRTAEYLLAELNALGFESALQTVDVPAVRLVAPPRLVIAHRTFSHRRDFAEMTALSAGGHVKGQLLVVRDGDLLPRESFNGRVVLIPERPQDFNFAETVRAAADLGVAALLAEFGEPQWFHKTVFPGNAKIPALRVRKSMAEELAQLDGAEVELNLPLHRGTLPCNNVLGFLRGKSNAFTLALTAHYDHMGDDPDGVRFPGALDNASGVVSILEVARELVKEPLPFNLLVAFLTGEESGLWGAKHLIANPPVPISAAINLDGIGSESKFRSSRLGHKQPGDWLAGLSEDILLKRGIQAKWIGGRDDSTAFISKGIPTVGLGQQPTGETRGVMHTPFDTLDALHLETIQEGIEILLEIVKSISELQNKEKKYVHAN